MAFTDNFDAGTTTDLESWTPSGGSAWTRQDGVAGGAIAHSTNGRCRTSTTTRTSYVCDDQGSANHYVVLNAVYFGTAIANSMACCRLVDANNGVGWRIVGTGSSGRRLSKVVGGTVTDLVTSQGAAGEWIKVEADGSNVKLFEGGTGASPGTWNQVGTTQTYSENTTETSQGIIAASSATSDWIDDFEASALTSPVTASPGAGDVAATGAAPTVSVPASNVTAAPGDVAVAASTAAPSAAATDNHYADAADVALSITAAQPALAVSDIVIGQPGAASVLVSVLQPSVSATDSHTAQPGTAEALVATFDPLPVATSGGLFQPGDTALSVSALAPAAASTDNRAASPGDGALSVAGEVPGVNASLVVAPGDSQVVVAAQSPVVVAEANAVVAPGSAVLALSAESPAVAGGVIVSAGSGSISVSGIEPTLVVAAVAEPGASDGIAAVGSQPSISVSDHVLSDVPSAVLVIEAQQPWIAGTPQYALPGAADVAIETHAPGVWPGVSGRLLALPAARPACAAVGRINPRFTIATVRAK